ncbi:predicted protein [Plenodomus lingam JN3]|uniref:Predicted protein n=1 Tax=Leptosphaeria maculans (strain JN3 / isolate v23.1.3 / race Av1-4-5-6-7-8) TaxID=985895 RepID=E5ABX5_LEPMJ|nr:predicted protein [Plenodomus lingam JN3]CBY01166.1 predicted protein [Plenodomus lingam JN3]
MPAPSRQSLRALSLLRFDAVVSEAAQNFTSLVQGLLGHSIGWLALLDRSITWNGRPPCFPLVNLLSDLPTASHLSHFEPDHPKSSDVSNALTLPLRHSDVVASFSLLRKRPNPFEAELEVGNMHLSRHRVLFHVACKMPRTDPNTERLGPDTRNDVKQYEMMYTAHRTLLIEICSYARLGRRRDPGKQCLGGCEHASFAQSLRGALRSGEDDGKPWNAV